MIAYYKLLDLLNRKHIPKEEFRKSLNISSATMAKISKNEPISMLVLDKICDFLNCQPSDVIEFIRREKDEDGYIQETVPILDGEDYISYFPNEQSYSPEFRLGMERQKKFD